MAASEDAYYVVAQFQPQRGPRLSASLRHRGLGDAAGLRPASALAEPKGLLSNQICRHRLI